MDERRDPVASKKRSSRKKTKKQQKQVNLPLLKLILSLLLLVVAPLLLTFLMGKEPELPDINPYRPEDFVSENGFMTCLSTESVPGIDVSYYQGDIDWEQVRQAGIEFAFVRVGFRRSATGTLGEDELAKKNLREARNAGLKVGAYFFSQATSVKEAQEEAEFALNTVKGFRLDLPLAYDWEKVEGGSRTNEVSQETLMKCIKVFCDTVEDAGYESMVYFNRDLSQTLLDVRQLGATPVWLAMYHTYPDAPCKPTYWQYTDQGEVPGINGYVDLNLYLP
jgi:GH25 family lysozyme M1 (1,4-beta-N-acetylmuramidase)